VNPWTALLQSLHSALIDELTDRHPEPKPELGMPSRQGRWSSPDPALSEILLCEVLLDSASGIAFLAAEPGFTQSLKLSLPELWDLIFQRAGSEFMRRGIKPKVGRRDQTQNGTKLPAKLPEGYPQPGRIVWIPFKIPGGTAYLGMGI